MDVESAGGVDAMRHAEVQIGFNERELNVIDRLLEYVEGACAGQQKGSAAIANTALHWLRSDARKLRRRLATIAEAAGIEIDDAGTPE